MKTTSKNQELTPIMRTIPNEISASSSCDLQILGKNTCGKDIKNLTQNKRPKTSQLEINVFQLNERNGYEKHIHFENEKF